MDNNKQEFFKNLVLENINAGFVRGQELFAEALNYDLEKSEILESIQLDGYIDHLIQNYQK